ncbi:PBP1A family penicillin-binding protein [Candidatus Parcubacteria bacterium]|nr:PBP1A family penicillin-binding protein [Candidatus Parcubacteria bacterium]
MTARQIVSRGRLSRRFLRRLVQMFLLVAVTGVLAAVALFLYVAKDLPTPESLGQVRLAESTKIYDRTGEVLLYEVHGEEKRTVIPADQIPQHLKDATVAIEDVNFYKHRGIDFRGIVRATIANLRGRRISQGGSTITQQFVKNSLLTAKRTWTRKVREVVLAIELELFYRKDDILAFYLNQIPYGAGAYGVEAASKSYFGKSARDLTVTEAAALAALPKAPSYYSPYGNQPEELLRRKDLILDKMFEQGYLTETDRAAAKATQLAFQPRLERIGAPHFVFWVRGQLEERYGPDVMERAGLTVITTLDAKMQAVAERVVREGAARNEQRYNAGNASLVAVDPKTGQVLAMVGSRDYFDRERDGNVNVALRLRQPGSAFKPFAYATAFKKGFTPETVIFDIPTNFSTNPTEPYAPSNYDDRFRGPVTMRQALAQSLNIPSVKTLYLAGVNDTIDTAEAMGITSLKDRSRFGLALVLGGAEVRLLELTQAYGAFSQEGLRHPTSGILRIEDSSGTIVEAWQDESHRVLEPQIARLVTDILSDNKSRAPVFGERSSLFLPDRPVAAKTGTTENYRDAWIVGYTPSFAAGVWVGNNDAKPMAKGGAGVLAAGPIWHTFMQEILAGTPVEQFSGPDLMPAEKSVLRGEPYIETVATIDSVSGKLATDLTPPEFRETRRYKSVHTILSVVDPQNPNGPPPSDPTLNPQYRNWEDALQKWITEHPELNVRDNIPVEYDDVHTLENIPKITVLSPNLNSVLDDPITVEVALVHRYDIEGVEFYLDGEFVAEVRHPPYRVRWRQDGINGGEHMVEVKVRDAAGNRASERISFTVNPARN